MAAPHENQAASLTKYADRRAHPRFPCSYTAVFHRADGARLPVEFHDVSASGVSFSADQPLKIGQTGMLELSSALNAPASQRFEVVIQWAVSNDTTKRCRVGCKWLVPLGDVELARLM